MRSAIIAAVVAALVSSAGTFAANRFIITNAKQQISGRALREIEPSVERGRRGPQGIQGYLGPFGPPGPAGPKGDKGTTGAVGNTIQGETGPQGKTGATGPEGPRGEQGPPAPNYIIATRICMAIRRDLERERIRITGVLGGDSNPKDVGAAPLGAKEELVELLEVIDGGVLGEVGCAETRG